jgi:hypothetical protein
MPMYDEMARAAKCNEVVESMVGFQAVNVMNDPLSSNNGAMATNTTTVVSICDPAFEVIVKVGAIRLLKPLGMRGKGNIFCISCAEALSSGSLMVEAPQFLGQHNTGASARTGIAKSRTSECLATYRTSVFYSRGAAGPIRVGISMQPKTADMRSRKFGFSFGRAMPAMLKAIYLETGIRTELSARAGRGEEISAHNTVSGFTQGGILAGQRTETALGCCGGNNPKLNAAPGTDESYGAAFPGMAGFARQCLSVGTITGVATETVRLHQRWPLLKSFAASCAMNGDFGHV